MLDDLTIENLNALTAPIPAPLPEPIVTPLAAVPVAQNHHEAEVVKELSEAEPEKARPTPMCRSRLKAAGKWLGEKVLAACDRAFVLLIALLLLATLKGCAGMAGVPVP